MGSYACLLTDSHFTPLRGLSTRIPPWKMPASCPGGHALVRFSFTAAPLTCDFPGCGRRIRRGETHDRCEECDYDLCNKLHEIDTPARQNRGDQSCNSASIPAQQVQRTPEPLTPQEQIARLEEKVAGLQSTLRSIRASGPRMVRRSVPSKSRPGVDA